MRTTLFWQRELRYPVIPYFAPALFYTPITFSIFAVATPFTSPILAAATPFTTGFLPNTSIAALIIACEISSLTEILYGGSVDKSNVTEIFSCKDVGGLLIGGVSLKAEEFSEICLNI